MRAGTPISYQLHPALDTTFRYTFLTRACAQPNHASKAFHHHLGLQEELEVVRAAGFAVGAAHVEAAEGLGAHHGAGDLAIEIQVPHLKLGARSLQVATVP